MIQINHQQIQSQKNGQHMLAHFVGYQMLTVLLNVEIKVVGNGFVTIVDKMD
jgi:hypothetical protein